MRYLFYACLLFIQVACGQVNTPKQLGDTIKTTQAVKNITQSSYSEKKLVELGKEYIELGTYSKAIEVFNRAIKINPEYLDAYLARADCYEEMSHFTKAITDLQLVLKKDKDNPLAYNNLGSVFFRKAIVKQPLNIALKL